MKRAWLVYMFILSLFVGACDSGGDDEGGKDTTPQQDTAAQDTLTSEDTESGEECPGLGDLTGKSWRILNLKATSPTDQLDSTWAQDIAAYDLIIVFRVTEHNLENNTLTMTVTSAKPVLEEVGGQKAIKSYKYAIEPGVFQVKLNGCTFNITESFTLNVITPTVSKPFPVQVVKGKGKFADNGELINNGSLEGGILEESATDLCLVMPGIGTANFHWFMNLARICPDHDIDGDGTIDSYKFTGTFSAKQEDFFQEGLDPIIPGSTECTVDNAACVK